LRIAGFSICGYRNVFVISGLRKERVASLEVGPRSFEIDITSQRLFDKTVQYGIVEEAPPMIRQWRARGCGAARNEGTISPGSLITASSGIL
jgi:hypothetical protein